MYAHARGSIATPIGTVTVTATDEHIVAIGIGEGATTTTNHPIIARALDQLAAWFANDLAAFDLPLAPSATPRGGALRAAIAAIPYGETLSYGALARLAASSPRAIGQACARNPFPIVIPCHRVLAAGGRLGAYSAGAGPATKRWLLDHELGHQQRVMI